MKKSEVARVFGLLSLFTVLCIETHYKHVFRDLCLKQDKQLTKDSELISQATNLTLKAVEVAESWQAAALVEAEMLKAAIPGFTIHFNATNLADVTNRSDLIGKPLIEIEVTNRITRPADL